MPILLAQVRFFAASNKTEDDLTNSWHFSTVSDPPSATTLTAISAELDTFYSAFYASVPTDWTSNPAVKYYNLADPTPRAPIRTDILTLPTGSGLNNEIPREMCCVVSFKAATLSGVPMARRRGRVYLPPFNRGAYGNDGRFLSTTQASIRNAANALLTASVAAADWEWIVYSKVSGGSAPVIAGWVDNAPDTQRRRGQDATARNIFP